MSATKEIERLIDFDMWERVALVFAGFLFPLILQTVLEGRNIVNLPNEVYGLLTIVAAGYGLSGSYRNAASVGGGLYVVDHVAKQRIGIDQTIAEIGA